MRTYLTAAVMMLATFVCSAGIARASNPPVIFQQSFTGTSATGFLYGYQSSGTTSPTNPCLTAATTSVAGSIPACSPPVGDASGSGALRLTNNSGNQSGFVIYNSALSEFTGLEVIFNIYMYNGTGADGISFFLIDGSYSPTTSGANGGSLGYAQKIGTGCCDASGLVGGFIGIGFDSYGNYSNPTEGRSGGPGAIANTVAIRGAASTSYAYVTGYASGGSYVTLPFSMTNNSSTTRPTAVMVRVLLSSSNILTVDMDSTGTGTSFTNVIPPTNLSAITGQPSFPPTFKFGWAASTGGSTDIHEINTFNSYIAPPYLTISKQQSSSFPKGVNSTYSIQVTNSNYGGPADQTITMTDTIPNNETYVSASGTGWTCSENGTTNLLTCTYPATVSSGTALPPITLTVTPTKTTTITNTACVSTPDQYNPTGSASYTNCSSSTVTVGATTPLMTLWKRITSILRSYGYSTPTTITPTPDPGSSPGLNGTASSTGIDPGDYVTYTLYFSNDTSGSSACGSSSSSRGGCVGGPDISDLLSPSFVYQTGTQTFTCCSNPTATNTDTFTSTSNYNGTGGTNLDWLLGSPLQPASTTNAVEGSITYQVKVP